MLRDKAYLDRIWTKFNAQKSTLVHGFTQEDYTPEKDNDFNYM